jgi:hypothetical protein
VNNPLPLLADAILPSLVLIWPITIFLLLPVIGVEAQYARTRLHLSLGQAFRVFGIANVASMVVGFPIATGVATALQNRMNVHFFGTPRANFDQWNRSGDVSNLMRGLGQYPRWTLIAAAVFMFAVCFIISWWVEAAYVKRWLVRKKPDAVLANSQASRVVRNANILSYLLVAAISIGVLAWL